MYILSHRILQETVLVFAGAHRKQESRSEVLRYLSKWKYYGCTSRESPRSMAGGKQLVLLPV